ncbi:ATP-dependent DNA helicase Q1 [Paramuricea clavata]|uniref:DNA 3'-5' helicase n=1 Tax=Paramuricea clavata TaxID=317549 RepID=A0A6S7GQA9_PARCT|nr:ATP-dependent DNA helicase Q1 [Paramuricea clavata]
MASESRMNIFLKALSKTVSDIKCHTLKPEQQECIRRLIYCGEDVLAVLSTGFGKSLVYQLLQTVYQNLHLLEMGEMKHFMIVVVSPLEYIRQQQVANVAKTMCGVCAAVIGKSEKNDKEISEGKYNVVYGGAEQWLNNRWKKCLQTVNDIVSLLTHFLMRLGTSGIYTDGEETAHERCLLGVYYSQTPKNRKESVSSSFEGLGGNVRLVFASTSLSMGTLWSISQLDQPFTGSR